MQERSGTTKRDDEPDGRYRGSGKLAAPIRKCLLRKLARAFDPSLEISNKIQVHVNVAQIVLCASRLLNSNGFIPINGKDRRKNNKTFTVFII